MASALRQAIRYKLTPAEEDELAQRYRRFGVRPDGSFSRERALAAAFRRRYRQEELGIQNIAHANALAVHNARQAGALGYHPGPNGLGGPLSVRASTPDGSAELDPNRRMAGTVVPGLAGPQAMADPVTGGVAAPALAATPVVPNAMGGGSPLVAALRDAASAYGDRPVQKPRRRRPLYGGGGGGGG